ncbi:MAG: hypothetical protein E6Q73_01245 [Pseudorhodobacter sp.]|nr:MAG: hypothetical protein E6Q73_01245 [Pseudorhodobacter sp.]
MFRIVRFLVRSLILLCLLASLAFNVMLVTSEAVFAVAAGAIGAITGRVAPHVRASGDLAEMAASLEEEKRLGRSLRDEAAKAQSELAAERKISREVKTELAENAAILAAERKALRKVEGELAVRSAQVAGAKIAEDRVRKAVAATSRKVSARLATAAKREVTTAAGEAIPGWGVGVIVAATTLELADLCYTIVDMRELEAIYSPEIKASDDELTICAMKVPSKKELLEAAVSAPGKAWDAAVGMMPDLDRVDWSTAGKDIWEGTVAFAGGAVDGAVGAATAGADAVSRKNQQFLKWLYE